MERHAGIDQVLSTEICLANASPRNFRFSVPTTVAGKEHMTSAEKQLFVSDGQAILGEQYVVQLSSTESGAALTVRGPDGHPGLEIEIAVGPHGPIARLRTAAVHIETAQDVDVRCRSFRVDACEDISLRSQAALRGTGASVALEACVGSVVARANDDVQLLGENVLLNCDRTAPVPDWVTAPARAAARELLGVEDASGDVQLISMLNKDGEPGNASS